MKKAAIALILLATLTVSASLYSQLAGGGFIVKRTTIDNGGGRSESASFIVTGTIGQPDASTESSLGGDFIVTGGFWANGRLIATGVGDVIFQDGFETSIHP